MDNDNITYIRKRTIIEEKIPVSQFRPYHKHPRKDPIGTKKFDAFCADVRESGVREQIFARYTKDEKNDDGKPLYEIISGHCRWMAAKEADFETIYAKIVEIDDDKADELVTSYNFSNRDFSPSEIGKFCKLWMDSKNKQGKRGRDNDETSNRKILVEMYGLSSMTDVHRHIRYAYLIPEFQDLVDEKKGWRGKGENISYLNEFEQKMLHQILTDNKHELTTEQSIELKNARTQTPKDGTSFLTEEQVKGIIFKNNNDSVDKRTKKSRNIKVPRKSIEKLVLKYFGNQEPSEEDLNALIMKALEAYVGDE